MKKVFSNSISAGGLSYITDEIYLQADGRFTKITEWANGKVTKDKNLTLEQCVAPIRYADEYMHSEIQKNIGCKVIKIEYIEYGTRRGWRGASIQTQKRVVKTISDWELIHYEDKSGLRILKTKKEIKNESLVFCNRR